MSAKNPLFDLTGRTALITGSSQGIGLALACGLAQASAAVVLNGRDATKLAAAADTVRTTVSGARVTIAAFDVTNAAATFRPSCTTELIRGGANLWHVKERLGHEHLDSLQHYAKVTIADLKKRTRSVTPANARVETRPPLRTLHAMTEIIFEVREDEADGGYTASALGVGVHSQGDTLAELRANVKEAVDCYFDETMEAPKVIRLHFVRDEVLAR